MHTTIRSGFVRTKYAPKRSKGTGVYSICISNTPCASESLYIILFVLITAEKRNNKSTLQPELCYSIKSNAKEKCSTKYFETHTKEEKNNNNCLKKSITYILNNKNTKQIHARVCKCMTTEEIYTNLHTYNDKFMLFDQRQTKLTQKYCSKKRDRMKYMPTIENEIETK